MKNTENNWSVLLVSLDFELFWGVCSSRSLDAYKDHVLGGREAIPKLLDLFEKHSIHATWATVGFIFADDYEDAGRFFPAEADRPSYDNAGVSSYLYFPERIGRTDESACYYAPSLIERISKSPGQEIGSHTFSHYFCRESGQTVSQFEADLRAARAIADDKGYTLRSLILPRNQSEPEYTKALAKLGFTAYRDEENDWIHEKVRFRPLKRFLRLMDVYFPLTGQGGYVPKKENGVWNFIGSRMFKPYFGPLAFMEGLKIRRIKKQMRHAAKHGLAFHLWWHPHNIGVRTDEHLRQLESIFDYYDQLKEKYGMASMNMQEAAAYFSE